MMLQVVVGQIPTPAPPPPPELVIGPPWAVLDPGQMMFVMIALIVAATLVLYPLMRALGKRLEGRSVGERDIAALKSELDTLRAQVAEVESGMGRVAELEERVDFAERLLAQQREPARLDVGRVP